MIPEGKNIIDDLSHIVIVPPQVAKYFENYRRLEPATKTHSIEEGVQARVKDPLWFLGRQWQMGEFRARNGGNLVRAELSFKSRALDTITRKPLAQGRAQSEQFDLKMPLEMKAEEETGDSPTTMQAKGWDSAHLEYSFSIKKNDAELIAEEYDGHQLDWYNFNIMSKGNLNESEQEIAVKPSQVSYHGMPSARWWTFEDRQINIGDINRPYLNFLTMMMMEFALIYSNDWYIIPLGHKVGHIRKIERLQVMDSFGVTTEVVPVIDTTPDKQGWEVFTLNPHRSIRELSDGRLFYLPNNLYYALESEPIEKVSLLRDEMANLVWAIEQTYQNENGERVNRHDEDEEAEREHEPPKPNHYWDTQEQKLVERAQVQGEGEPGNRYIGPVALYQPMSDLPPHWIPYIPRRLNSEGQFILRRARTKKDVSAGPQYKGLFIEESKYIFEEEISRSGIMLSRVMQLARDSERNRYVWRSRRKKPDQRRKSSGLRFDYLVEK